MADAEHRLLQMAKAGDTDCFERLIEGSRQRAYNIALRYLREEQDAMDALQESLIKVYRNLDRFQENSRFDTWVYRIVINTCNDMIRKSKRRSTTEDSLRSFDDVEKRLEPADPAPGPEQQVLNQEQRKQILDVLEQLPKEYKEILILREIQGFSYEEIMELLDCSLGTVKSRISRARMGFRDHWNQYQKLASK